MIEKDLRSGFEHAIDSMKKYRRYDLTDESGRDQLNLVYVDPMLDDSILNVCLKDNTTVLIGRKGTGKSTIFMRMQNSIREDKASSTITTYIDVKSTFDKAVRNYTRVNSLSGFDETTITSYSIQRQFMLEFLTDLLKELSKYYKSFIDTLPLVGKSTKLSKAIDNLDQLKQRITNNDHLSSIEIETLQEVFNQLGVSNSQGDNTTLAASVEAGASLTNMGIKGKIATSTESTIINIAKKEEQFKRVFARIFEIDTLIEVVKETLTTIGKRRLFVILDDYSEVDRDALKMFSELVISALNNNSDEYIKFKISAYPGRVELGDLDNDKIDIRYLDYYQLYSTKNRDDMEIKSLDYTMRIIDKRIEVYTKGTFSDFFDLTLSDKEGYCRLIFQQTFNVVRHIGKILEYANEHALNEGKKISPVALREASKKLYNESISSFFDEAKATKITYDEKINRFQLKELNTRFIEEFKNIKKKIRTNEYTAQIFEIDRTNPFTSHFHIDPSYSKLLESLELNFIITKYNEMIDSIGKKVDIYALNYGLATNHTLRWGKPEGHEFRTYFIKTQFNFDKIIRDFIGVTRKVECSICHIEYEFDKLEFIKSHNMNCLNCMSIGSVEEIAITDIFIDELETIIPEDMQLTLEQYRCLRQLYNKGGESGAGELALELDISKQKIGWLTKKLDEEYYYLVKNQYITPVQYTISEKGKLFMSSTLTAHSK